jgi:predicted solute-binding protein
VPPASANIISFKAVRNQLRMVMALENGEIDVGMISSAAIDTE